VAVGVGLAGLGAGTALADTPLPGPADVIGLPMAAGGVLTATAGGLAYGLGSLGGLIDYAVN